MIDFPKRAYDHSFHIDPVVRHLSDTDFYKLLMLQFIWQNYLFTSVSFSLTNRTKSVLLSQFVDVDELRAQLDHIKTLKWQQQELNFLKAQEFYGERNLFKPAFLDYLEHSWKLSDYTLRVLDDGQIELIFEGSWAETTMWEIYALTTVNELRYRKIMSKMDQVGLDIMYSQAKVKLYRKLKRLSTLVGLNLTDFGTRRRHSFLWQEYCVLMAKRILGDAFTGTSNVYLAMKHGLPARGTNAHELPMVMAALVKETDDEGLRNSPYEVLKKWQAMYGEGLRIFLPDTYGTTQFLRDAPFWVADWRGGRPDSKKAAIGGEELIEYWNDYKQDPLNKLIVFSDGLDVKIEGYEPQGEDIVEIFEQYNGRVGQGFGWGTMFTNDLIGCHPDDPMAMKPLSIVCKVYEVEGVRAVKLSDNRAKATGSPEQIVRYSRVFGDDGIEEKAVMV